MDMRDHESAVPEMATLAAVVVLACVAAIGAIAAVLALAREYSQPPATLSANAAIDAVTSRSYEITMHPRGLSSRGGCPLAAWNAGTFYCIQQLADARYGAQRANSAAAAPAAEPHD